MAVVYQIFYTDVSKVPHSVEAYWAYNTEVRRSKPRSAITFCCCPFLLLFFVLCSCVKQDNWRQNLRSFYGGKTSVNIKFVLAWYVGNLDSSVFRPFFFVGFILMLVGGAFLKHSVQISGPKKLFKIKIYKNGALFCHQTCPNCCVITQKLFPLLSKPTKLDSLMQMLQKRPGLLSAL